MSRLGGALGSGYRREPDRGRLLQCNLDWSRRGSSLDLGGSSLDSDLLLLGLGDSLDRARSAHRLELTKSAGSRRRGWLGLGDSLDSDLLRLLGPGDSLDGAWSALHRLGMVDSDGLRHRGGLG